jgi:hypothetical protein
MGLSGILVSVASISLIRCLIPMDAVILVDALLRGKFPGTLYTIEPDMASLGNAVKNKNEVTR